LPIGGLKEKLLAAHRGNIKKILIPEQNLKDLIDIPDEIKHGVDIIPVKWIDQVIELALTKEPKNLIKESKAIPSSSKNRIQIDKAIAH
jgi:ATP-dependent Lon protease